MTELGIPLNILLGTKTDQKKLLNVKELFGISDMDWVSNKGISNKRGQIFHLDTSFMKTSFEDFKESLIDTPIKVFQLILEKVNYEDIFKEHYVIVYEQDLSFCDGQINSKIFQIVKITKEKARQMGKRIINYIL